MAEYIDREALREILDGWRDAHADVDDVHGCGLLEDVICEVDAQTAVDVAPVVHARWVSVAGKRDRICSRCLRNEPYKNADDDAGVFEFCPHCGAKMDGGGGDAVNQR